MRLTVIVAIVLIALGLVALAYQGIAYATSGNAFELVPLGVTTENTHRIPLPPILTAIVLVGGITLLVVNRWRVGPAAAR